MKTRQIVGTIAVIVICITVWARNQGLLSRWVSVKPSDGSFSILMPGTPNETTSYMTSRAYGKLKVLQTTLVQGKFCYQVSWVDYPEGTFQHSDSAPFLDEARDGAVQGVQGKLLGEEHVEIAGHPGRKIRIEPADPQTTVLLDTFVAADRAYQIMLVCPKQDSFMPQVSKFRDSFELLRK